MKVRPRFLYDGACCLPGRGVCRTVKDGMLQVEERAWRAKRPTGTAEGRSRYTADGGKKKDGGHSVKPNLLDIPGTTGERAGVALRRGAAAGQTAHSKQPHMEHRGACHAWLREKEEIRRQGCAFTQGGGSGWAGGTRRLRAVRPLGQA